MIPATLQEALMIRAALIVIGLSCAPLQAREVQGGAVIEAGAMLAADAVLLIEVQGRDGILAEASFPVGGRQSPLPFRLTDVPSDPILLRAAIREAGAVTWLSEPIEVGPGAGPVDLRILPMQPHAGGGFISTMICGGRFVQVGFAGDGAVVSMGGEARRLSPSPSASGARFADGGAQVTSFWSKGRDATVVWSGVTLPECDVVTMPDTANITARGNEPGWRLDLSPEGMRLTTETGVTASAGALPPAILRMDATTYVVPGLMVATLLPGPCSDTMSGMVYPLTASLDVLDPPLPGLMGCAGDPLDLLQGDWSVVAIGDSEVPQGVEVTIRIDKDRIGGISGCNRYSGGLTLTGESLTVGPVAMTRIACPPDRMILERKFTEALQKVDRFDIRDAGRLTLIGGDRILIVASP
jgi:heat shock protein HslJ/uncharacterized membrane protein